MSLMWPRNDAYAQADLDAVTSTVSPEGFTHPGVFVGLDELKTTKARVLAKEKPWSDNFNQLAGSAAATRGAPDFTSFASADATDPENDSCSLADSSGCIAYCGPYNIPNIGCSDEQADARAVYGQALLYWYTGDDTYAQRAVAILNAYAAHFKGTTGSNGPLVTAWIAAQMTRGAEIIRYIYEPAPGDAAFDVAGFSSMLRNAFVPELTTYDYGSLVGNWKLSATDGLISTAVFLDDRALYNEAVGMWRESVESYIYLTSDGAMPIAPENGADLYQTPATLSCYWLSNRPAACRTPPKTDPDVAFQNGQLQETCRDFAHTSMGLSGIINTAETAWLQGLDLYGEQQDRILTGLLYHIEVAQNHSQGLPPGYCGGLSVGIGSTSMNELAADVAYNAYAVRKGVTIAPLVIPGYPTPASGDDPIATFIATSRSNTGHSGNLVSWEGLTHHLASATAARTEGEQWPPHAERGLPNTGSHLARAYPLLLVAGGVATVIVLGIVVWRVSRRR